MVKKDTGGKRALVGRKHKRKARCKGPRERKREPTVHESKPKLDGDEVTVRNKVMMKDFSHTQDPKPGKNIMCKKTRSAKVCSGRTFINRPSRKRDQRLLIGTQSTGQRERNLHHN